MSRITTFLISLSFLLLTVTLSVAARVETKKGRVYIVDRTGYQWDVTQAKKLGFIPRKFQYGIGKNAFTPLQDRDFRNDKLSRRSRTRVIGIASKGEAHAYEIKRLSRHEIANTTIAGQPIAAGY